MTALLLVRHGRHGLQERVVVGRTPGVALAEEGRAQADALAREISVRAPGVALVQASPQQRTRETAAPIAAGLGCTVAVADALDEVDCGAWTGKTFEALGQEPSWRQWNAHRAVARAPGGESMLDVQARIVAHTERLRAEHPDGAIVLVSHGDVIRSLLLYHLGLGVEDWHRIEVEPGSLSTIVVGDWGAKVVGLNWTPRP